MMLTLNKITERITLIVEQLRETDWRDAIPHYEYELADSLEAQLAMFTAGFKACQDAVIFEKAYIVDPETEIEVPKQWEKYFEKEQEEYQEYLRLKEKFENGK